MQNYMAVEHLYNLYKYLEEKVYYSDFSYDVYEPGVLDLYNKLLHGEVGRRDFLVFAIKDILDCLEENGVTDLKYTAILTFKRIYMKDKK